MVLCVLRCCAACRWSTFFPYTTLFRSRVRDPHVRPGQGVATVRVLQGGPVVPGVLGCGAGDIGAVAAAVESWAGAIRPAGAGELDDVPKASWLQPRRRGVLDAVGGDEVLPAHGDLPAGGHHHPPGTGSV